MIAKYFSRTNILLASIIVIAAVLRFYQLGQTPLGLFGDEIDAGYNAYSLLKTGRDYNGNLFPIHFESMGDYRPFLFIWSLVPAIATFGLTEFSVRLTPSIWGLLGIYLIYLLSNQLLKTSTLKFGLLPAFLLAIVPWHLHYSRAAFEATLMISLLLLGVYALIKSITRPVWIIAAAFCFGLNAYSYNIGKLYSPLLFLILLFIYRKSISHYPKHLLISAGLLFIALLSPLIYDSTLGPGQNRFNNISILNHPKMVEQINFSRGQLPNYPEPLKILFHNKAVFLISTFTEQYYQSLSPNFLFITGDLQNPRHSLPKFGLLYFWLAPFFLLGLYHSWNHRSQPGMQLLLVWLFTAPIPSALTLGGDQHATRLIVMLPPLIILAALGLVTAYQQLKFIHKIAIPALSLIVIVSMAFYLQNYYHHYSQTYYRWWNYGFQPALQYLQQNQSQYDNIIITRSHSHLPMLYYLFYTQYDPAALHQQFQMSHTKSAPDPTDQIGKYRFATINLGDSYQPTNSLYLTTPMAAYPNWFLVGELPSPDPQETTPIFVYLETR